MANTGETVTLKLSICAPIPVGHEVVVQYWERDMGIFGSKFQRDDNWPGVIDRTTGIAYGTTWHPGSFFGSARQGPCWSAAYKSA